MRFMVAAIRVLRLLCLQVAIFCSCVLVALAIQMVGFGESNVRSLYGIGEDYSIGGTALRIAALGLGAYVLYRALKALLPESWPVARKRLTPR